MSPRALPLDRIQSSQFNPIQLRFQNYCQSNIVNVRTPNRALFLLIINFSYLQTVMQSWSAFILRFSSAMTSLFSIYPENLWIHFFIPIYEFRLLNLYQLSSHYAPQLTAIFMFLTWIDILHHAFKVNCWWFV